jgi:cell division inhibitor SepF
MLGFDLGAEPNEYMEEGTMADVTPLHGDLVAPAESFHKIVTCRPRDFQDAPSIGLPYREGTPVILNMTDVSDNDAVHLRDFASGLVMAMDGTMEKITPRVFLLSPPSVEVQREAGGGRSRAFARD